MENSKSTIRSKWADFPFSPKKWPFFYGWVIVIAATVGAVASIPGQTIGVGVFTDKLINALNLSRTQLSAAYMFGTITSSLLLPFAGTFIDKWGTRVSVVLSACGLGISLFVLSNSDTIAGAFSTVPVIIGIAAVCFLLIRFFGQGCLTLVSRIMIGKWFNHRRGLATGISTVIISYTFNASPTFLNEVLQTTGWQDTYLILAVAVGIGMSILGWIFYRDNPEECGLIMDGKDDPEWVERVAARVPETVKQFTRREAIKTLEFWNFAIATGWQALLMTAVTFHITSMGAEMGLNRDQSYAVFPMIGFGSMFVVMIGGWLSDRIRLKWLLQATIIAQFLTTFGLLDFSTFFGKIFFVGGYSVSSGLFGLLLTVTWPRYFGRDHLGAISGLVTSILVFSSAIGPFMFSSIRDLTDSFRAVTLISLCVPVLMFIPSFFVENPQTKLRRIIVRKIED